jgi:Rrf2 family protein
MAVHILTLLAKADGEKVKSDYVAESVNTNAVVIRRIISQLREAGLVSCQTGSLGGTTLSRPPKDISLCEVYKAVSCGEVFALHAKSPNQDCPIGKNIEAVLCRLQKEIDAAVGQKLGQYSLADLLNRIGCDKN